MICQNCKKEILEEYQLCQMIGSGSYSDIYLICNNQSPKYIAKKLLMKDDSEFRKCKVINNIENVNFSKYITTIENKIIYEYIDGYNLQYYFYNNDLKYFTKIILNVINQLLELKRQGYYYLDINKNNIIIKNNIPYLIDYGTLTHISSFKVKNEMMVGSYGFVPPEYFINKEIVPDKFDIFSIGLLLFERIYNFSPYSLGNYYHLDCLFWCKEKEKHSRNNCLLKFMEEQNKEINDGYKYLIMKCLEYDSKNRISLSTASGIMKILIS